MLGEGNNNKQPEEMIIVQGAWEMVDCTEPQIITSDLDPFDLGQTGIIKPNKYAFVMGHEKQSM